MSQPVASQARAHRLAAARTALFFAVIGGVIGGGFGLLSPGILDPAAATAASRALRLDPPSPPTVYEDNPTTLTGRLAGAGAGAAIVLEDKSDAGWVRVGSTTSDQDGHFSLAFSPIDPGVVVLRALHRSGNVLDVSRTRRLTVLDRRVYLFTKPSYDTFTDVRVTGHVSPAQSDRHVVIQHLQGGVWVSGRSATTDSSGRFVVDLRQDLPGSWNVRAYWPGGHPTGGSAEYSGPHQFTVVAVLHPVVTSVTRQQLGKSWHPGCPVGPSGLRNVALTYQTFGATVGRGTLVVATSIVARTKSIFGVALVHGFPIRHMFATAHYNGSDISSMFHDNTSAFNCRDVTGEPGVRSPHSWGNAIDVDPVENPYQDVHGTWWPRSIGHQYRDRAVHRDGMLYADSPLTKAFTSRGFRWGGGWSNPDYQHFDTNDGLVALE